MYTDVLIIGGGLASLYTALNIKSDLKITIITKGDLYRCNSSLAQGGIAACIDKEDSYKSHIKDTFIAGNKFNNLQALNMMVKTSKERIDKLIEFGVFFDKYKNGKLKTTMEGGHSNRRILHAGGDITGKVIMDTLISNVKKRSNITVLDNTMAIDLIKNKNICIGAKVLNKKVFNITSKHTVIATGGIGGLFKNTTNTSISTGDGIALAYRAGCNLKNMEFIQFHPTAFYSKEKGKKFLISEAVRGEGAYLKNKFNERFMLKYHKRGELAPRDIVARGIYKELIDNDEECVYLDATHLENSFIKKRFPNIYKKCLENGFDMCNDYIPVIAVEHYFIGGIETDFNGLTNIKNLYACGECANTGVHGANRLASNSLLECITFGYNIAENINNNPYKDKYILDETYNLDNWDFTHYKKKIQCIMDKDVGIVRNKKDLLKAEVKIEDILNDFNKHFYSKDFF